MSNEKQIYPTMRKFKKAMVAGALGMSMTLGLTSVPVLNPVMTVEAASKKDKKKPKITYKGKKKFTVVSDGSTYRINKVVKANDNVDGNVTKKLKVKVKKGNKNIKNIAKISKKGKITLRNTDKLEEGNYTLIVEVSDKAKNKAKKKIAKFTVVPEKKDYVRTETVIVPEVTTEAPKIIESTEAEVRTTEMNEEEVRKLFKEIKKEEKTTEVKENSYKIDEKDINYYEDITEEKKEEKTTEYVPEQTTTESSKDTYVIDEKDIHFHEDITEEKKEEKITEEQTTEKVVEEPKKEETTTEQPKTEKIKSDRELGVYENETYYADSEDKIYYYYQPVGMSVDGETPAVQKYYVTHESYKNINSDWKTVVYIVTNEMFYLGELDGKIYYKDQDNWIWYFGKNNVPSEDGNIVEMPVAFAVTTYDYNEINEDWKEVVKQGLYSYVEENKSYVYHA